MTPAAPAWDAFQREALAELGLRPLRMAPAMPAPAAGQAPDALLDALARAAGCPRELLAGWDGLAALRGDARAKRALWPRLRRLRAERRMDAGR